MGCSTCLQFTEIAGKGAWRVIKIIVGIVAMVTAVLTFVPALNAIPQFRYFVAGIMALVALIIMFDSLGIERVLQKFRQQIARLSGEVDRLEKIEQELENTNKELQHTSDDLKSRTREYGAENKQFKQNNSQLGQEVAALQTSNKHLVLIEKNAQQLIQSLMQAGDDFTKFGPILKESVGRMEDVNTSMERILYELAEQKFNEIDADGDGNITQEELLDFAKRRKAGQKKDSTN
jgi:methyl-accepting chemotaxis protein